MKLTNSIFHSKIHITVLTLMFCLIFCSCNDPYYNILHSIHADAIKTYSVADKSTSDRGFHNDGSTFYIFSNLHASEISQVIDNNAVWTAYSSDAPINLLLHGGQYEDVYYNALTEFTSTILDGYYYFIDMQNTKSNYDIADIIALYNRASIDYILAVIDISTNTLYYFQFNS